MDKRFVVSPSPHIFSPVTTASLMRDVLIALIPAFVVSVIFMGISAVTVTLISVAACVATEALVQKFLLKTKVTTCDYSAILTGVLLAFNLPASIPWWIIVIGAVVAIGVGKISYGGLGRNLFNPALVGRVFLLISFPVQMTSFPVVTDATSGATPLAFVKEALKKGESLSSVMPSINYSDMFLGNMSGSLGEIAAGALLLGFIYLLWRKVITWHIPVAVLGSMAIFSGILHLASPEEYVTPLFHLLAGGAMLGAIFMATDYVTSPMNTRGAIIYGIGIGVITILIRTYGAYPEGISFAILIMNATVPLINNMVKPKRFGTKKVK